MGPWRCNGSTCALLFLVLTISATSSLPVGTTRSTSTVSDRRRNDARALPVVISQYSNVRNSKTDNPALKDSTKAAEPETTTTSTTTTISTNTTEAKTTGSTEATTVPETAVKSEQIGEELVVLEIAPPVSDPQNQQATGEDSTLSPPSDDEQSSTPDSPIQASDPDTKAAVAPIQVDEEEEEKVPAVPLRVALESEDSDQNRAGESLRSADEKSANMDSEKSPEEQVKDIVAKEVQKDSESATDDSNGSVAPLSSPPAQPTEQEHDLKLEQLFEEDRSFKNSFDDLSPLIDENSAKEPLVTPSSLFKELFQWNNDDDMRTNDGESVSTLTGEKKSEVSSKNEKEKLMNKLATKEGKSNKKSKLNDNQDPVDEYEDNLRKKRSAIAEGENDESEANPPVITSVPSNYPVVLPNGESTLSDRVKPDEQASTAEQVEDEQKQLVVISLVPANYPVVLPDGTATLSDQIPRSAQEESEAPSGNVDSPGPVEFEAVPSNFPVVLPDGTQTLSDQVLQNTQEGDGSNATAEIALVPDSFPVVLPNGEQTTSDKV